MSEKLMRVASCLCTAGHPLLMRRLGAGVTGPAAPARFLPGGRHRRNVFALKNSRLDVTSFDVMDGAAFGFGPTQSGLDHQSGAGPVGVGAVVVVEVAIGVQVPGVVGVVRGKRKI